MENIHGSKNLGKNQRELTSQTLSESKAAYFHILFDECEVFGKIINNSGSPIYSVWASLLLLLLYSSSLPT